jgi:hypothetical protein
MFLWIVLLPSNAIKDEKEIWKNNIWTEKFDIFSFFNKLAASEKIIRNSTQCVNFLQNESKHFDFFPFCCFSFQTSIKILYSTPPPSHRKTICIHDLLVNNWNGVAAETLGQVYKNRGGGVQSNET